MIILSVGMPRAGSGWYYNLTHDLVVSAGGQDARSIRQRYRLQNILTEVNCNIGALTLRRLLLVLVPSLLGNTFVIKAHAAPSHTARRMIAWGLLKAAYIYRDPRDAMLSAYENGQRALVKGRPNAFSQLTNFDAALEFMQEYVRISEAWLDIDEVLHTRYENFVLEYENEAQHLARFQGLDNYDAAVIDTYRPEQASQEQKGTHFRKGKIGRYRDAWTPEQQEILAQAFHAYLKRMSYPF